MKRYVGGKPRLTVDQAEDLSDNQATIDTILEILDRCVERQADALLSAQMEQESDMIPLMIKRAKLEGAVALIADAKASLTKNSRS